MLDKIGTGETLPSIPRQAYNAFIDAALYTQQQQQGLRSGDAAFTRSSTIVRAYNGTGGDLGAGQIAAINTARIKPDEDDIGPALQNPVLQLSSAAADTTPAVLLEPIPDQKFGRVVVSGLAYIRATGSGVNATLDADVATLGSDGDFPVLWSATDDGGDPPDTEGERWALILMGTGGGTETSCLEEKVSGGQDALSYEIEGLWGAPGGFTRADTASNFETSNFTETYNVASTSYTTTFKYVIDIDAGSVAGSSTLKYADVVLTYVSGDDQLTWSARSITPFRQRWQRRYSEAASVTLPDGVSVATPLLGTPGT
jgi:hypothetical protein